MLGLELTPLIISVSVCLLIALLGNIWVGDALRTWYPALVKPRLLIPVWAFILVGLTVYVLDGIVLYRALAQVASAEGRAICITALLVVMVGNEAWNGVFFGMRNLPASFVGIVAFVGPLVNLMAVLIVFEPVSAWLMAAYCVWVVYDVWWVYQLWRLNPDGVKIDPLQVNIASPEHKRDPYPFYARLRAERPVHCVTLPDKQKAWLISRYDDVTAAFKDERLCKDKLNSMTPEQLQKLPWVPAFARPLERNMLDLDEPDHVRLRALVNKAFTPRLVEELRPKIEVLTDELLTVAQRRGGFDLMRDYALPVPTTVIAQMLGIPPEDRHRFTRWSRAIVSANTSACGMLWAVPNLWLFLRYIRKRIRERRQTSDDDVLSALVQAEEAGQRLSEDELVAMAFLLLVAGYETTVNLIGNGTLALLKHPDQLAKLRDDPGLIKPAIEELLRYASPLETATERYARVDMEIAGMTIPRGAIVFLGLASANRDERHFERPNVLDITREPNKHVAFGLGAHYCLGAPLARLEAQIAINALLRRARDFKLAVDPNTLRWNHGLVLRGLRSLPLTVNKWI